MKIFLLEDDFSLNESIKDMLESENFIVDSFYDGKVALDNISGDYELFILDIFVPNLNGILLLEKIKKINKNSIVFIMSANIDIDTIKGAYLKGCDDYIKKPFNIQELLFKLANLRRIVIFSNLMMRHYLIWKQKNSYTIIVRLNLQKMKRIFFTF